MTDGIKIVKTLTEYVLSNEHGERISAAVCHGERPRITIKPPIDKRQASDHFGFIQSDPERVGRIAELISRAALLVSNPIV